MPYHSFAPLVFALLAISACASQGGITPIHRLDSMDREWKIAGDALAVERYRQGLKSGMAFIASQPDVFPTKMGADGRMLTREQKQVLWNTWSAMRDYFMALESIKQYHAKFIHIEDGRMRRRCFSVHYAAFAAQYRFALAYISALDPDPSIDVVLNEKVPELSLPKGTYAGLKFRFLNVGTASQFAALETVRKAYPAKQMDVLKKGLEEDTAFIWEMGKGRGHELTFKNALNVVKTAGQTAWFPVQAGVSEWMGDTKVKRKGRSLVSPEQLAELQPDLLPGDILFERREWYLSNIGLPGFWPHVALYLGTSQERAAFFGGDEGTAAWVREQGEPDGDFEALLRHRYPEAYEAGLGQDSHGDTHRLLEAVSEGVIFTSLEHSADCDSLAVLRPRLEKWEIARGILQSYHFRGRPYDFNFDFLTDSDLVCTELVYKAFQPTEDFKGLNLPIVDVLGHKVSPANDAVKQFDSNYGTDAQQFDLIAFFDGYEKGGRAVKSTLEEFRKSWKRPKWHVMVQDKPEEGEP